MPQVFRVAEDVSGVELRSARAHVAAGGNGSGNGAVSAGGASGSHAADLAELEALRAENAALKARQSAKSAASMGLRVSEKGAVSVYGLGRFPVTLYAEQWVRLLAIADEIKAFIVQNKGLLKVKGQS